MCVCMCVYMRLKTLAVSVEKPVLLKGCVCLCGEACILKGCVCVRVSVCLSVEKPVLLKGCVCVCVCVYREACTY